MELDRKAASLMIREFDQAWQHYRHIETTRNQYLGFFFTAILASLGLLASILDDVSAVTEPMKALSSLAIGWVLFVLSYFLFTSVLKMGAVLEGYEHIMGTAREYFYEVADKDETPYISRISIRENGGPLFRRRLFGAQTSVETIFRGSCYALSVGVAIAAMNIINVTTQGVLYRLVAGGLPVTMILALVYLEYALRNPPHKVRDSGSSSGISGGS